MPGHRAVHRGVSVPAPILVLSSNRSFVPESYTEEAQHADTVLLSVLRGASRLPSVYAARQRLAALDIPVLGAVVVGGSSTLGGLDIQYPRPAGS